MKETLRTLRSQLTPLYGRGESEAIIRLIFEHLKGWRPVDIVLHEDDELSLFMREKISNILARLRQHEPIQYIIGHARFYGLDLEVNPSVLIPRPETEELVELAIKSLGEREDLSVLDACTGSGCIALALARNLRFPQIEAIDISEDALKVARKNAERLRVSVQFDCCDVLRLKPGDLSGEPWDAIISNPPYIGGMERAAMEKNVLDYEPHGALFVPDREPLLFYKALAHYGRETLRPGAGIFFEINPLHATAMQEMMLEFGYCDIDIERDMYGKLRFLTARNPS